MLEPPFVAKVANSDDENCGPLSETRTSGTPYRENMAFRDLATPVALARVTFSPR